MDLLDDRVTTMNLVGGNGVSHLERCGGEERVMAPLLEQGALAGRGVEVRDATHHQTIGITNALDSFFEAAGSMRDDPAVRFLVVGDGSLLPEHKRRFSHLPNVTFAPKMPKQAVQSVLAACDLLYLSVHKSKVWEYGQSLNKVIDYMLAGKPVVACYTGFPSMIDEAGCGTYVPAGDVPALIHQFRRFAAMSPPERSEIGERGRQWILEHRNYRSLARDYLPILFPGLTLAE